MHIDTIESLTPDLLWGDVLTIRAKDPFRQRQALEALLHRLGASSVVRLHEVTGARLQEALHTAWLWQEKRVVIVEKGEMLGKEEIACIEAYQARKDPHSLLIILRAQAGPTSFPGIMLALADEKPWEKEARESAWVRAYVESKGKKISPDLATHVVKRVGDPMGLAHALDACTLFVGEKETLDREDIDAIVVQEKSGNVWDLQDALFQRDMRAAIEAVESLHDQGIHPLVTIRTLRSSVKNALSGKRAVPVGVAALKAILVSLDAIERHLKSGPHDEHLCCERLLCELISSLGG